MAQRVLASHPKVGEVFKLRLVGDNGNENHPMAMVRQAGYGPGWTHNGHLIVGDVTQSFVLVELDDCSSFDEVLDKLACHGRIPEGQWVRSFKTAYGPNVKRHVAIADAAWVGPDGRTRFPCISRAGDLQFHRSNGSFGGSCRLWIIGEP